MCWLVRGFISCSERTDIVEWLVDLLVSSRELQRRLNAQIWQVLYEAQEPDGGNTDTENVEKAYLERCF